MVPYFNWGTCSLSAIVGTTQTLEVKLNTILDASDYALSVEILTAYPTNFRTSIEKSTESFYVHIYSEASTGTVIFQWLILSKRL